MKKAIGNLSHLFYSASSLDLSLEDIREPEVPDAIVPDVPVEYKVLEKGSVRGGRLLVSSNGYSYCVKVFGFKS